MVEIHDSKMMLRSYLRTEAKVEEPKFLLGKYILSRLDVSELLLSTYMFI